MAKPGVEKRRNGVNSAQIASRGVGWGGGRPPGGGPRPPATLSLMLKVQGNPRVGGLSIRSTASLEPERVPGPSSSGNLPKTAKAKVVISVLSFSATRYVDAVLTFGWSWLWPCEGSWPWPQPWPKSCAAGTLAHPSACVYPCPLGLKLKYRF